MTDPTELNIAICEALGLNPRHIRKNGVTIHLDAFGPIVTVQYGHMDQWAVEDLAEELRRYKLVPIDENEG